MKYAELVDGEAKTGELKSFLVDGENVAVTIRIPKNMRDAAKDAAAFWHQLYLAGKDEPHRISDQEGEIAVADSDDLIKAVGANIQKASLIWSAADTLRGPFQAS